MLYLTSCNTSLSDGTKLRQGSIRVTSTLSSIFQIPLPSASPLAVMTGSPCLTTSRGHQMNPSRVCTSLILLTSSLQPNTVGHPHREHWHQIGRKFKQRFHFSDDDELEQYPPHPAGSCRVQAVRSVSDWSHGVLTEHSIQNACE